MSNKIFLIGLPGAGKTTLGMELAVHLGIQFIDLDQEIEKDTKQSISSIFKNQGEPHFRQLEQFHLHKVITELSDFVLATGGGTPCFFDNMDMMKKSGKTFFINTPIDIIKERLSQDTGRPLMQSNSIEDLQKKRLEWYKMAKHEVSSLEELIAYFN